MATVTITGIPSEVEARAYALGVAYVNDSSLYVLGIHTAPDGTSYIVLENRDDDESAEWNYFGGE